MSRHPLGRSASIIGSLGRASARLLSRNRLAFRFARRIVNYHDGSNNDDIRSNGELHLARAALPHCRVVFDVGANVGDWTALALTINAAAQYHCFEPSGATFRRLSLRPFPPTVRRNQFGLGALPEVRSMFEFAEEGGANSLYFRVGTESVQRTEAPVVIRVFDTYCEEAGITEVDFAKIDVEGHELAVLQGASRMLTDARIGVIQFEYGGTYIDSRTLLRDVWDLVEKSHRHYRFFKLFPDGPRAVPAYRQSFEDYQYANWMIARPDWAARFDTRQPRS